MAERMTTVRIVPGDEWIADGRTGQPTQEFYRYLLRREFYDRLPGQWRLVSEPKERTEFDEKGREVKLSISALVERKVKSATIDYGARGGQPFGYA